MNTILHLGLGSFHRAHQAVYVHQLRQLGDLSWGITGGNLRPDMLDTIAALQAQGGAYTLGTVTPQGEKTYTRVTSIQQVLSYQDDLAPLVAVGADAATRIISFTVTEAGYYLDAQNRLDWASFADLRADLDAVKAGRAGHTIYGGLVTLLRSVGRQRFGPMGARAHHQPQRHGGPHHAPAHTRCGGAREGCHRYGRPGCPDGRELHPVGDRRPFHRGPP